MIQKSTVNASGVSQTTLSIGPVKAVASTYFDGQWHSSVRLIPPSSQQGYPENQLDDLQAVVTEAVSEAKLLLMRRSRG